ncbi:MAG: hypothetical protein MUC59_10630 [Saprospiraceae bacterium]|jgi:hypothetical protein|nr:hypothetical protein [Saprospiraceae bacterium]
MTTNRIITQNKSALVANALLLFAITPITSTLDGEIPIPEKNYTSVFKADDGLVVNMNSSNFDDPRIEQSNKYQIIQSFVQKLLNESRDLEPEIIDMVNKNFWELL